MNSLVVIAIAYAELQVIKPIQIQALSDRISADKGKFGA